jgi:hypothetical protein
MQRSTFLNDLYAVAEQVPGNAPLSPPLSVAGIALPDSPLAREATSLAASSEAPAIFNHSIRSFLFSQLIARERRLDHDVEAAYVAAILHDTGLSAAHASDSERFEVDGANLARGLLAKHGAPEVKGDLVWDAVALHYSPGLAKWKPPEVQLVNAGVAADFGRGLGMLQRDDVVAVLAAAPRTDFIEVFLAAVAAVAARKPLATGNTFVTDVAYRMVPGFHLVNFCDTFSDAPFAAYAS